MVLVYDSDLLLYDQTTGLPLLRETSKMKCLLLAICTEGEVEYTVDTVVHKVSKNDILIVSEGQVMGDYKIAPETKGVCLLLSYDFFQEVVSNIRELTTLFLLQDDTLYSILSRTWQKNYWITYKP